MISRFASEAWTLDPAQRSEALEEWKGIVKKSDILKIEQSHDTVNDTFLYELKI